MKAFKTREQAEKFYSKLRKKYKQPVPSDYSFDHLEPDTKLGAYCIGGAIMMEYRGSGHHDDYFPSEGSVADALENLNPQLTADRAYDYADEIVMLNDHGKFTKSWNVLKRALSYKFPRPKPTETKTT